jgi:hypothetical protein
MFSIVINQSFRQRHHAATLGQYRHTGSMRRFDRCCPLLRSAQGGCV